MLGGIVKGIGTSLATGIADVAGLGSFTSALGAEKPKDKPKAVEPKPFDEDEAPTKVLQRIFSEVQTIHKVMASQVVPPSEEDELERDKDVKDDEVLQALADLRPEEEKDKKKKKSSWWKMAAMAIWEAIKSFIKWITKPLSWIKSLLKLPFIMGLARFATFALRFFLFNPVGIALLTIGIIAINWRAIKKTIKGYWATFKGWVKNTLNWLHLGWMIKGDEEDPVGEDAGEDPVKTGWHPGVESFDDDGLIAEDDDAGDGVTPIVPMDKTVTAAEDDKFFDDDDVSISTSHTGTVSGLSEEQAAVLASQGVGSTDETTGPRILGEDYPPVVVTPDTAGDPVGDVVGQNAVEDEYVREYGTKFEPNPDLDFGGMGTYKYKKLTTNEERLKWLDKRIKLASSSEYHSINVMGGEGSLTRQTIGGLQSEKERVLQYAGQFQTGGVIPKGKVGLAGEAGPESIGGQMLEGPSLVEGPAKVKREKQYPAGDSSRRPQKKRMSMREYWKRQASHSIGGGVYSGEFSQPVGKKGSYDREYLRAGMTEADQVAEGKADNARRLQQEKDMTFQSGKAGGLDAFARHRRAGLDTANWFGMGQMGKALVDQRNVTKQAQAGFSADPTSGFQGGKAASGLAKVGWDAELIQKMIKGRSKGRGGEEFSPKQIKFYMAVADFGIDFAQLRDINNTRIRELGALQDAAGHTPVADEQNWAITILNAMRVNLSSQDLTEKVEGDMRMVAARMQNLPSIPDTELHQAGQIRRTEIVNVTNTQNISTASSESRQANIGSTHPRNPISNRFGAAPASV